mgnify:CR=1 FL=1
MEDEISVHTVAIDNAAASLWNLASIQRRYFRFDEFRSDLAALVLCSCAELAEAHRCHLALWRNHLSINDYERIAFAVQRVGTSYVYEIRYICKLAKGVEQIDDEPKSSQVIAQWSQSKQASN